MQYPTPHVGVSVSTPTPKTPTPNANVGNVDSQNTDVDANTLHPYNNPNALRTPLTPQQMRLQRQKGGISTVKRV
jgi:hypothetical protein